MKFAVVLAALTAATVAAIPAVRGNRNLAEAAVDASAEPKLGDAPTTSWKTVAEIPKLVADAYAQICAAPSDKKDTYWTRLANGYEVDEVGKATHNLLRVHEFWLENTRSWLDLYVKVNSKLAAGSLKDTNSVVNHMVTPKLFPNSKIFDSMKDAVAKIEKVLAGPSFQADAHKTLDFVHNFVPEAYGSFSAANKGDQIGYLLKYIGGFLPNALKESAKALDTKKKHLANLEIVANANSVAVKVKADHAVSLAEARIGTANAEAAHAALTAFAEHFKSLWQGTLLAASDKGDSDPKPIEAEAKKLDQWLKWLAVRQNWYHPTTLEPFPVLAQWNKYCEEQLTASSAGAIPNNNAFKQAVEKVGV